MVHHTKLTMVRIYLIIIFIWIIHFIDFFPLWFLFPSFLSVTLLSRFTIFFICCKFWFPNFYSCSTFFFPVFICFILRVTSPNLRIKENKAAIIKWPRNWCQIQKCRNCSVHNEQFLAHCTAIVMCVMPDKALQKHCKRLAQLLQTLTQNIQHGLK